MTVNGVVLVHGGVHSAACWNPVRKHLRAPAVAVDLPGRASRPADLAAVVLADCVKAVIDSADEAGFDRFVLCTRSYPTLNSCATKSQRALRKTQRVECHAPKGRSGVGLSNQSAA